MRKMFVRACKRFDADQSGHAAVLFAFSAIPLIALMGGAVDTTRYVRYKTQIANAMDAAAVALVRRGAKDDADADLFINDYLASALPQYRPEGRRAARTSAPAGQDPMLHLASFDATQIDGGYRITSSGYMDTAFLPVVGISEMPLDLSSEVMMSTGKYEVALVLDNTGSMREHGRIGALRDAAGTLVTDLYKEEGTKDRVKMALVPFVTAVNIATETPGVFSQSWINPAPANDKTYGFNFTSASGAAVDRLTLFGQMKVDWKGCVEARPAPYDEDDTAPTNAATRWVPYLWPDEPDGGDFGNSYLEDSGGRNNLDRLRDTEKYGKQRRKAVVNTISKGPNAACPRAVVELTNDDARMQDEIARMVPHNTTGANNSGTNVAEGMMWGWRVLSPEEPFSQGAQYDDPETQKVLVLLSDGRNQIVANDEATGSDYTSYGYLAAGRLGSTDDYLVAEQAVDAKVKRVCEKVKATGIRVYTILFQVDFKRTQDVFRDCASKDSDGNPLYYHVPKPDQLETVFSKIGEDLTNVRISR